MSQIPGCALNDKMLSSLLLLMSVISALQGEVCYDRLGCFNDKSPWAWTLQRPISRLPWAPERINTRFLLYTRNNLNAFQEVSAIQPKSIIASNFKASLKTTFIIHGFTDSGENSWLSDLCKAMLEVEDVNCFCVDWHGGSLALYTQASNNIRVVGAEVAFFIDTLEKTFGYPPSNVHIIGHSLGAHTAGEAGKRKPGVGRITGLDPAQPYFQDTPPEVRLDPSDALLVDAIHTDGSPTLLNLGFGGYGMSQTVGHLDFFPNGGFHMPGCRKTSVINLGNLDEIKDITSDLVACNHLRSFKYYLETIINPEGFLAYPASSYAAFQVGGGFPCPSGGCPVMGHFADRYRGITPYTQTFYLNTGDAKTFARWRYKVSVQTAGSGLPSLGSIAISLQGPSGKTAEYTIYKGKISAGSLYTAYIDVEMNVGNISKVTFVWRGDLLGILHLKFGASAVTVQYGKDGSLYSFCDNAIVSAGVTQILSACV